LTNGLSIILNKMEISQEVFHKMKNSRSKCNLLGLTSQKGKANEMTSSHRITKVKPNFLKGGVYERTIRKGL